MASFKELVDLLEKGEIGKLLETTFQGKRGRTFPNKDSDLLVVFENEEKTPTAQQICDTICPHFQRLGYETLRTHVSERLFETSLQTTSGDEGFIAVTISTRYPFDGHHASLRITTIRA